MDAQQVVDALHDAGLSLALTPEQGLKVTPASALTPELRELILASKTVLIDLLARMRAASLALNKVQAAAERGSSMVANGEVSSKVSTKTHGYEPQGFGPVPGETAVRKELVRSAVRRETALFATANLQGKQVEMPVSGEQKCVAIDSLRIGRVGKWAGVNAILRLPPMQRTRAAWTRCSP